MAWICATSKSRDSGSVTCAHPAAGTYQPFGGFASGQYPRSAAW